MEDGWGSCVLLVCDCLIDVQVTVCNNTHHACTHTPIMTTYNTCPQVDVCVIT